MNKVTLSWSTGPTLRNAIAYLKTKFEGLNSTLDPSGLDIVDGIATQAISILDLTTKSLTVSFLAANTSFQFEAVVLTNGPLNLIYPTTGSLSAGSTLSVAMYKDGVGQHFVNGYYLF